MEIDIIAPMSDQFLQHVLAENPELEAKHTFLEGGKPYKPALTSRVFHKVHLLHELKVNAQGILSLLTGQTFTSAIFKNFSASGDILEQPHNTHKSGNGIVARQILFSLGVFGAALFAACFSPMLLPGMIIDNLLIGGIAALGLCRTLLPGLLRKADIRDDQFYFEDLSDIAELNPVFRFLTGSNSIIRASAKQLHDWHHLNEKAGKYNKAFEDFLSLSEVDRKATRKARKAFFESLSVQEFFQGHAHFIQQIIAHGFVADLPPRLLDIIPDSVWIAHGRYLGNDGQWDTLPATLKQRLPVEALLLSLENMARAPEGAPSGAPRTIVYEKTWDLFLSPDFWQGRGMAFLQFWKSIPEEMKDDYGKKAHQRLILLLGVKQQRQQAARMILD